MYLRKLLMKDAPFMLEWMKDPAVVQHLHADFLSKTLEDAERFIASAEADPHTIHYAIASDDDEYMGTVSLKNIQNGTAEFAITVRSAAMKRGYAWFGMETILQKAFSEYGLDSVYWCVSRDNTRAVRFYDKHHFYETLDIPEEIRRKYADVTNLKWYSVLKGDLLQVPEAVAGCKVLSIRTVPTLNAGELSFFECETDIPFPIQRLYYISKVPEGTRRGFHAHKKLKQFLFCPYGQIQLVLENENGREEIELSDPSVGVLIDRPTWREMLWIKKDSVLCVAASEKYDAEDYIRDYEAFKTYIGK